MPVSLFRCLPTLKTLLSIVSGHKGIKPHPTSTTKQGTEQILTLIVKKWHQRGEWKGHWGIMPSPCGSPNQYHGSTVRTSSGCTFFSRQHLGKWCNFLFVIIASALQTDKSYNIKRGTTVNLVMYDLIWAPDTAQACNYLSALEKHMSGGRSGEKKGSLGQECTSTIRAFFLLREKQISWWIWVAISGTQKKKSESPSHNLDLSSVAYANMSEDCTLKTSFSTAYMKNIMKMLCSRDR